MSRFFSVFFLTITLVACGQKTKPIEQDKERIDKVCDSFMNLFGEGKSNEALQLLKENTVMSPTSIDTLKVTINNQMSDYFPAYGKLLSADFVSERKIKDYIAKRFYILKFEKYYLKFDFTIYKGSGGWTITNFKYNEDLIELLY